MCGIIGYIGSKDVVPVLVDGLRRLEYRGYDSAGIALVEDGRVEVRRSAGKLARLEEVIRQDPVTGSYGVGHTRWATHGRPTEENAHPHRDCTGKIVVVHNGIIENFLELKHQLQTEDHRFETETDTEVVAHLVEREMRDDGLENAVRRALTQLRGLFGLVLVAADDPDKIVAVRNGPPIVLGIGDEELLVASDIPAVLGHTRDVVFLGDEEMAVLTREAVEYTDFAGHPVSKPTERIQWDPVRAEKAGYTHFMLKEIFEQPRAIQETVLGRISEEHGSVILGELGVSDDALRDIEQIVILACGTSWHAGLVGKFLIERLARVRVDVDYGSEYRYRDPIAGDKTLAILITQSGETADTLAALREASGKGARSIAICNVVGSMATRDSDGTMHTHAGPEIGVASTKAFTSQLVALNLIALYLGQLRGTVAPEEAGHQIAALTQLPGLIQHTLECDDAVSAIARRFYRQANFLYLGRGINYPIALEGALKLKEISYIHAEGYPAGEMKHGPIALIDENLPVVALVPRGPVFEKMMSNLQEVKARGGSIIAVTDANPEEFGSILDPARDGIITIPVTHPVLNPLLMVVPLQLLAYHIAVLRGCDVDQPRNLAKSVTVE
jgi:glucosamine--fructose-6-phosphate aminotransferase (isomerizing)